jgi:hypothetical protein
MSDLSPQTVPQPLRRAVPFVEGQVLHGAGVRPRPADLVASVVLLIIAVRRRQD